MRYLALQKRYSALKTEDKECLLLDSSSSDGKIMPSRDFARRFKFAVVEDYPKSKETVSPGLGVRRRRRGLYGG